MKTITIIFLLIPLLLTAQSTYESKTTDTATPKTTEGEDSTKTIVPDFIELKNGETVYGKVELHEPLIGKNYITLNDTVKYELEEVDRYQNELGFYAVIDRGIAMRTHKGKLDPIAATVPTVAHWQNGLKRLYKKKPSLNGQRRQ
ncbi:MAG: hypothetical protein PVH88_15075 [Ignavibacteria bacterium]